jgi:hypothetical protein
VREEFDTRTEKVDVNPPGKRIQKRNTFSVVPREVADERNPFDAFLGRANVLQGACVEGVCHVERSQALAAEMLHEWRYAREHEVELLEWSIRLQLTRPPKGGRAGVSAPSAHRVRSQGNPRERPQEVRACGLHLPLDNPFQRRLFGSGAAAASPKPASWPARKRSWGKPEAVLMGPCALQGDTARDYLRCPDALALKGREIGIPIEHPTREQFCCQRLI